MSLSNQRLNPRNPDLETCDRWKPGNRIFQQRCRSQERSFTEGTNTQSPGLDRSQKKNFVKFSHLSKDPPGFPTEENNIDPFSKSESSFLAADFLRFYTLFSRVVLVFLLSLKSHPSGGKCRDKFYNILKNTKVWIYIWAPFCHREGFNGRWVRTRRDVGGGGVRF